MKQFLTSLLILAGLFSFAQNKQDTIYFDESWVRTKVVNLASYYRIMEEKDGLYRVKDYYLETDSLQMTGAFKDYAQTIKEGEFIYYTKIGGVSLKEHYKDGELHGEKIYYTDSGKVSSTRGLANGILHGDFITYYENGGIKRKETFDHGNLIDKACYLENGEKTKYLPDETPANYPDGGMEGVKKYIMQNLKYPKAAAKKKIEGKVYIQFVVSTTGEIINVTVKKGVHPALDEEAVRIVKSMPKWNPGMIDGKVVNSAFAIPITFSIRK